MNITIIGTGYVGLVTGACFADVGHNVTCLDKDSKKIRNLKKGILPIYEKKLSQLVESNYKNKRLLFTTSYKDAVKHSQIIFIAVDTPPKNNGHADLSQIESVCIELSKHISDGALIIEKSTVPVGTSDFIKKIIDRHLKKNKRSATFSIASNPEFLKEGSAVDDFMKPDRIIIGLNDSSLKNIFEELYRPFNRRFNKIQFMDVYSSELTKYASNAILATKISFINELSNIAENLNVDIELVRKGIGADKRIGYEFLYPGCGYGGSCLPKDINALINTSKKNNYFPKLLNAVNEVNNKQKLILFDKLKKYYKGKLKNKKIAVWGLAFKPNTDDTRFAPSLEIVDALIKAGSQITAYDPIASLKQIFDKKSSKYREVASAKLALKNADALIICTEWKEFWSIDPKAFVDIMEEPLIFDGRNIYSPEIMKNNNILYFAIGRGSQL